MPEGIGVGEDFDAVCTFRMKGPGTICLVTLGDSPMPGYGAKDEAEKPKQDYSDVSQSLQQAGGQGG